jgi:hypothetical protein
MVEILIAVLSLFFAWFIGALYGWNAHDRMVHRTVRNAIQEFEHNVVSSRIKIKIELHNSMLFAYDYETKQFMAQGRTQRELEKQLQEKFPDKMFAAEPEDIYLMRNGVKHESI